MTPLTKALLSKCEFDETALKNYDRLHFQYENGVGEHGIRYRCLREGAQSESARLMPLILALAECVEALEQSMFAAYFHKDEDRVFASEALERLKGYLK